MASNTSDKTFKILFVDNSRTTRAVMSNLLQARGYTVDTAGTGQEAIEKLKSHPNATIHEWKHILIQNTRAQCRFHNV